MANASVFSSLITTLKVRDEMEVQRFSEDVLLIPSYESVIHLLGQPFQIIDVLIGAKITPWHLGIYKMPGKGDCAYPKEWSFLVIFPVSFKILLYLFDIGDLFAGMHYSLYIIGMDSCPLVTCLLPFHLTATVFSIKSI
ncbi:hypothetical protein ACJX0J_022923, partial [Zea mays]